MARAAFASFDSSPRIFFCHQSLIMLTPPARRSTVSSASDRRFFERPEDSLLRSLARVGGVFETTLQKVKARAHMEEYAQEQHAVDSHSFRVARQARVIGT